MKLFKRSHRFTSNMDEQNVIIFCEKCGFVLYSGNIYKIEHIKINDRIIKKCI